MDKGGGGEERIASSFVSADHAFASTAAPTLLQNHKKKRRTRLKEQLKRLGGITDIDALLVDEAVSSRLMRFDYFGWDEIAVARKLHEFHSTRGDPKARREMLTKALAAQDLSMRGHLASTSALLRSFTRSRIDRDLDEIVGIVRISVHLNKLGGYGAWEAQHEAMEETFRRLLHFECLGLKESYEKSIEVSRRRAAALRALA